MEDQGTRPLTYADLDRIAAEALYCLRNTGAGDLDLHRVAFQHPDTVLQLVGLARIALARMKKSEPRRWRPGYGWEVDLARDSQSNCSRCQAPIYFVKIVRKDGKIKPHPLSEATARREGSRVWMSSHFSDCPHAEEFR